MTTIYISGMHSGQNPSSGLGIARCLKAAFPDLNLIGVDHWQGSTGLHDSSIDDTLLLPQWKQIDDEHHRKQIRSILDRGHIWIAAMDMEVHWLAENIGEHPNLLAPASGTIELTSKPAVKGLDGLGFRVPDYISASCPDDEIHGFLRQHSWQCWLKSPYHDAKRISSWGAFVRARDAMATNWKTSKLFLQRHVLGSEETIAFAAYRGELIGAAHMQKRQVTPEGKTWAARVTPVASEYYDELREAIRRINYTGGGEIEYARDPDGNRWIIECNPRFPAWVYGGALAGQNVVAKLLSYLLRRPFIELSNPYPFFTRVVQDIPAKESVGIPLPPDPSSLAWYSDSKKGKGGPDFSALIPNLNSAKAVALPDQADPENPADPSDQAYFTEVEEAVYSYNGSTPARIHLKNWARSRFDNLADRVAQASSTGPVQIKIGYSVKTCPTDEFLGRARDSGFYAECISQMEVRRALQFGFSVAQIILNGPGKFWPITEPPIMGLHALYCDSPEEFERVVDLGGIARVLGFRIRVPNIHSRFGNSIDEPGKFKRILELIKTLPRRAELGFHFHMPSWSIGLHTWFQALESLLIWCEAVERLSRIPIRHLDLGGGFFPADLNRLDFKELQRMIHLRLPSLKTAYIEPGRSLTQEGEVVVSRILDIRRDSDCKPFEIVVDACIAELPLAQAYSHRMYYSRRRADGGAPVLRLRKGATRVLGRICMEDDILNNGIQLTPDAQIGDLVIFGDAGAYERSMSYGFGRG